MLSITDIVALAKAGYKPNDVKELIQLSKTEDNSSEIVNESPVSNTTSFVDSGAVITQEPKTAPETKEIPETVKEAKVEEPDYKQLYEKTKIELATAQKANIKRDISSETDNRTDDDIIKDLIQSFI